MKENIIEFGKIVNTHGLNGEVKVYSYTDDVKNILKLKKVYIQNTEYKVQGIRQFKNMFLLKLEGIDTIEATGSLMEELVYREVKENESNDTQGYFIRDLIGLTVLDESETELGKLSDVIQTGANDVYEVTMTSGKKIYIPAIKDVVKNIDIASKKVIIKLMKGLVD